MPPMASALCPFARNETAQAQSSHQVLSGSGSRHPAKIDGKDERRFLRRPASVNSGRNGMTVAYDRQLLQLCVLSLGLL